MGQPSTEPSMEDILASIKRIIAEDGEAQPPARSAQRVRRGPVAVPDPDPEPAEDVVAAPDPAAVDVSSTPETLAATSAPIDTPAEGAVPDATEPVGPTAPPEPIAEEPADVLELTSPLPDERGPILSGAAEQASRNAFAALGQLQVRSDAAQPTTLEGLVADMLKPMLREWLDRELPALVERLVAAEIQRVSGRG